MKVKESGWLHHALPEKPASGWRIWELETFALLMALVWLLGAVQFFHHMI